MKDNITIQLGVFIEDRLVSLVAGDDSRGKKTVSRMAKLLNVPVKRLKVLMVCESHPTVAAIECVKCKNK